MEAAGAASNAEGRDERTTIAKEAAKEEVHPWGTATNAALGGAFEPEPRASTLGEGEEGQVAEEEARAKADLVPPPPSHVAPTREVEVEVEEAVADTVVADVTEASEVETEIEDDARAEELERKVVAAMATTTLARAREGAAAGGTGGSAGRVWQRGARFGLQSSVAQRKGWGLWQH